MNNFRKQGNIESRPPSLSTTMKGRHSEINSVVSVLSIPCLEISIQSSQNNHELYPLQKSDIAGVYQRNFSFRVLIKSSIKNPWVRVYGKSCLKDIVCNNVTRIFLLARGCEHQRLEGDGMKDNIQKGYCAQPRAMTHYSRPK